MAKNLVVNDFWLVVNDFWLVVEVRLNSELHHRKE